MLKTSFANPNARDLLSTKKTPLNIKTENEHVVPSECQKVFYIISPPNFLNKIVQACFKIQTGYFLTHPHIHFYLYKIGKVSHLKTYEIELHFKILYR